MDSENINATLETLSLTEGNLRYYKKLQSSAKAKGDFDRDDVRVLLQKALPSVSEVVFKSLQDTTVGRPPVASQYLSLLDPDLIALVGLSRAFSTVGTHKPLASAVYRIGLGIEDELWAARLHETNPELLKRLEARAMKTHGNIKYRRKAIKSTAAKEGEETTILSEEDKMLVGGYVLDCILKATDLFEIYTVRKGVKVQNWLGLSEAAGRALEEVQEAQKWMWPVYKPMTMPPRPWTSFYTGCYYDRTVARQVTLVRTQNKAHIELVQEAIKAGQMDYCLEAINRIQMTRWAINKPMLDLVHWAYETGKALPSFPSRFHVERPERPSDWDQLPPERRKGWRITASRIAQRNRGIDSEKIVMLQDFAVADALQDVDAFYLPHSMDFRGRVYPVPHFNQQRSDHIKSLLQFAEGQKLTQSGAYWLAVHVANTGDFDKISKKPFDTRVQWVADNWEMICQVALMPEFHFDIWSKADKPFQFVAACREWYGYRTNPEGFRSHIPVSLDGSNSGLQHFAASLRSPEEGKLVNLTPSEVPFDLYQTVADRVKLLAESDAPTDPIASLVLQNGITRSLVKRNVMTFAYSSEEYGFKQQLMADVMNPLAVEVLTGKRGAHPYDYQGDGGFKAASYIAKCVWKSVNEVVKDACAGMRFFRSCAKVLAHEGKGLVWNTPIGLPVLHLYSDFTTKRVKLWLADREVRVFVRGPQTKVVNKAKAADAVSPNVIHSLDSSHLMLAVLEAEGITDFSLIHDSFGVHANNTETMYHAIRQAFVGLYEAYCPFTEIQQEVESIIDDKSKVPEVPSKGSLRLEDVLTADYAFS